MYLLLFHKRRNTVNLYNIFIPLYNTNIQTKLFESTIAYFFKFNFHIMIIIYYVFIFLLKMQLIFFQRSKVVIKVV